MHKNTKWLKWVVAKVFPFFEVGSFAGVFAVRVMNVRERFGFLKLEECEGETVFTAVCRH